MATETPSSPSFSRGRRWTIGFTVVLGIIAVLAVAVMLNYLSSRYPQRFYLSSRTRMELSPRTTHFLHSLTNHVLVTLYCSKDNPLYSDIAEMLKEYHNNNPRITLRTVDYERDPGAAQEVKAKYKDKFFPATGKDLVIFDCDGVTRIVNGDALSQNTYEQVRGESGGETTWHRKPVAFLGEMMFTGALLAVTSLKPPSACFVQGHGEHGLTEGDDQGYLKFGTLLVQNYIRVQSVSLLTNLPPDCDLLIIAGPETPLLPTELDTIEKYLNGGGRLLALFDEFSISRDLGLEKLLAQWGLNVSRSVVKDPDNTTSGTDVIVSDFRKNPAVNPLVGEGIQLILPRAISKLDPPPPSADGTKVDEIAYSGTNSFLENIAGPKRRGAFPLMAAAEKSGLKGVIGGSTRILVAGDSIFLNNRQIESGANRDFAGYAVNWLLDRAVLMEGLGPKPIDEYRLLIPKKEMQTLEWILLAAMPGGILLLGGLVWLRRRH